MSLLAFIDGSVVYERKLPIANPMANPTYGVIGSVVKLNGQASVDPEALSGKSGIDANTTVAGDTISSPTGNFTGADFGRVIQLYGADAGRYQVIAIESANAIQVAQLDGAGVQFIGKTDISWSIDDNLSYEWEFVSVPIGSRVTTEAFRNLDADSSTVSFSPDVVGEYVVGLVVSNGVLSSVQATTRVSIRAILVPHGRGLVPDGKFIWSYIRDVWQEVANKEIFETFWSALIQICGAELLKLYQTDFNKSIRDIQDLYQRRWLAYEPKLGLVDADCTFYLGGSAAGSGGNTENLAMTGQAILISNEDIIVVLGSVLPDVYGATLTITADSLAPGNVKAYTLKGTNLSKNGYKVVPPGTLNPVPNRVATGLQLYFNAQSTTWSMSLDSFLDYARVMSETPAIIDELAHFYDGVSGTGGGIPIHVGDVVHYPTGPNAGFYRVLSVSGSYFVVDKAPPKAAEAGGTWATVYRPVEFELSLATAAADTSSTFSIPYDANADMSSLAVGRLISVGGQTYTILRIFKDLNQLTPSVIIVTDGGTLQVGQVGLNWRVANTLVSKSQNFEELGVTAGDLLEVDVTNDNANLLSKVTVQVVGVDRYRLSFVLSTDTVLPGAIPVVPNQTLLTLANNFGVSGVTLKEDGTLSITGMAASILGVINSGLFQRAYWNQPLTSATDINVMNGVFHLHPRYIIRNTRVPIDSTLKSVPVLQNWIVQPSVVTRGAQIYQLKDGKEYPIATGPVSLVENSDYIVDNEIAFTGNLTFTPGTNQLIAETGHFVSKGIRNGDTVEIESPSNMAGTYYVIQVVSNDTLKLNKVLPALGHGDITARLIIRRRSGGSFIRFVPGSFTAANPAPMRLWAEVSLFDNRGAIEDNFGILVGLTKADLEAVSTDINYRQAVAGLMYAYTRGSSISKIRLGAQILLGLPFAEHRGVVRSIENDYRLDDNGVPVLGRLLIEDTDAVGKNLGTLRVYTFPIDPISDLAGIDTNPATGVPYVVGDTVEAFSALSKGVEVNDYLTHTESSMSGAAVLRQFHTAHLRANDSIFDIKELGLLSDFLKKITPSYVALAITTAAEFADSVSVVDKLVGTLKTNDGSSSFVDQVSLRVPTAPKYDLLNLTGIKTTFVDTGAAWVRVLKSQDLVSDGTNTASFAAGGLLTSPSIDGARVRVGDTLVIPYGDNEGTYPILAVTDTTLQIAVNLLAANQAFFVLRYLTGEIRRGTGTGDGAGTFAVEPGLHADGVAPGDLLITQGRRTVITGVGPRASQYDSLGVLMEPLDAGELTVLPSIPSGSGKPYRIYREASFPSPYAADTAVLHSDGTVYTSFDNIYLLRLLDIGDELLVDVPAQNRLSVLDPANLVFIPVLPIGDYTVQICKKNGMPVPLSWTHVVKFAPQDVVEVSVGETSSTASFTASSNQVSLPIDVSWVKPGDVLVLSGAPGTVDIGYGPGMYPIKEVGASMVKVTTNISSSGTSGWKLLRRG